MCFLISVWSYVLYASRSQVQTSEAEQGESCSFSAHEGIRVLTWSERGCMHPGKVSNCVPRAICGDSESVKLQLSMTNLSQLAGADSGQNSFPRSHWSLLSTSILQLSERKFYFFMLCAENSTKFVKQWCGHKLGVCYPLKAPAKETPCLVPARIFSERKISHAWSTK